MSYLPSKISSACDWMLFRSSPTTYYSIN